MALCIGSQKAAREARRRLTSCYLCGEPLSMTPHGTPKDARAEHVIPKWMLKQVKPTPPGAWSLILDVHPKCDERAKGPRDQLAKLVGSTSPRDWSKEELGLFRNRFSFRREYVGGWELAPTLDGCDEVVYVAHLWARGCHAALYGESLPWPIKQWTLPPAPMFRTDAQVPHEDMHRNNQLTDAVLNGLAGALTSTDLDSISLYGGGIEFNCAWAPDLEDGAWMCLWTLDTPGADKWSMGTRGRIVPWHGAYWCKTKPAGAAELSVRP